MRSTPNPWLRVQDVGNLVQKGILKSRTSPGLLENNNFDFEDAESCSLSWAIHQNHLNLRMRGKRKEKTNPKPFFCLQFLSASPRVAGLLNIHHSIPGMCFCWNLEGHKLSPGVWQGVLGTWSWDFSP